VFNLIDSHCFQDVPRSNDVLLEVDLRSLRTASHVGVRLKVEHKITACHFLFEPFAVKDIGAHNPDLGIPGMVADEVLLTCAEIVVDSHAASRLSKPINHVAPDEAGAPSHESSTFVRQIHLFTEALVHRPMKFNLKSRVGGLSSSCNANLANLFI
jgi:hypothetical protein